MDETTFKATVKTLKFHKDVNKIEVSGNTVTAYWVNDKNEAEKSFSTSLSPATQALDPASAAYAEAVARDFVTAWDAKKAERKKDKDKGDDKD